MKGGTSTAGRLGLKGDTLLRGIFLCALVGAMLSSDVSGNRLFWKIRAAPLGIWVRSLQVGSLKYIKNGSWSETSMCSHHSATAHFPRNCVHQRQDPAQDPS